MRLPIACAGLLLAGCLAGGTGTDTENGLHEGSGADSAGAVVKLNGISARVVDGEGAPIRGVSLALYPPGYRPDSLAAPAKVLADSAQAPVSDSSGYVSLPLRAAGKFVVEGQLAGRTVFYDTLAVPDIKQPTLFTFRTRAVKAFAGKVELASGMRIDSGWVFIRGTGRAARVDTAGGYVLGLLPEDVGRMAVGVRFSSSPTSVRQATALLAGGVVSSDSLVKYTCNDVPKDSAAKLAMSPTPGKADTGGSAAAKLDTSRVSLALKSCDTLAKGTLVNVQSASTPAMSATGRLDSTSVPLLVVSDAKPVASVSGTRVSEAVVIPYAACVPSAGLERTIFAVSLQASDGGIRVEDVAPECLEK